MTREDQALTLVKMNLARHRGVGRSGVEMNRFG